MKKHIVKTERQHAMLFSLVTVWVICQFGDASATDKDSLPTTSAEEILLTVKGTNIQAFELQADTLHRERQLLYVRLVAEIKDANASNFQKCAAAFYLGEMRISEAAPCLAAHITLHWEGDGGLNTRLSILAPYPAEDALVKIGKPASKHMLENLESSSDLRLRELSVHVLQRIEGVGVARFMIQEAIVKQADEKKKDLLREALSSKDLTGDGE
jgi:hypothetical protein